MDAPQERKLEDALRLAEQVASRLAAVPCDAGEPEALSVRLAQAHALGLVDQLAEIVRAVRSER
jgi:hypothetical protein